VAETVTQLSPNRRRPRRKGDTTLARDGNPSPMTPRRGRLDGLAFSSFFIETIRPLTFP